MKQGRTLEELISEVQRRSDVRRDFIANQGTMEAVTVSTSTDIENTQREFRLSGVNGHPLVVTKVAHEQFATHLEIPKKYYDRMLAEYPDLLATNINTWLKKNPKNRRMIRTLDGQVDAFLSDKYRLMDYPELVKAALPVLSKQNVQIVSSEITERRLYIKAILPTLCDTIPSGLVLGEGHNRLESTVIASVTLSDSEVGAGGLAIEAGAYKTNCTNLMVFSEAAMKKYHVGRAAAGFEDAYEYFTDETRKQDDKALWMKVQDVLAAAFDENVFRAQVAKMKASTLDAIVTRDLPAVVEVTRKKLNLADSLQNDILTNLIQGQDLSRWGLLNAVTRTAEDQKSYDDATALERAGGKILELQPNEWKVIAQAA